MKRFLLAVIVFAGIFAVSTAANRLEITNPSTRGFESEPPNGETADLSPIAAIGGSDEPPGNREE